MTSQKQDIHYLQVPQKDHPRLYDYLQAHGYRPGPSREYVKTAGYSVSGLCTPQDLLHRISMEDWNAACRECFPEHEEIFALQQTETGFFLGNK